MPEGCRSGAPSPDKVPPTERRNYRRSGNRRFWVAIAQKTEKLDAFAL